MLLESAFHYLFCLKFRFKSVTFSKSYAREQMWVFFSEHSVYAALQLPGEIIYRVFKKK